MTGAGMGSAGIQRIAVALAAALLVTGCGSSGPKQPPGAARDFERAVTLKDNGRCDQAAPMLEKLADRGRGWELAQVHLADCLMQAGEEVRAVRYLTLASESNEPRAQARLALAHLEGRGGLAVNRTEAAKWYLLATRRTLTEFVADVEFPKDFKARMEAALTPGDLEQGRVLVAQWVPSYQDVNAEALRKASEDEARRRREEAERQQRILRRQPRR